MGDAKPSGFERERRDLARRLQAHLDRLAPPKTRRREREAFYLLIVDTQRAMDVADLDAVRKRWNELKRRLRPA